MSKYKIGLFSIGQTLVGLGAKLLQSTEIAIQIGSIIMMIVGAGMAGLAVYLIVKQEIDKAIEFLVGERRK